VKRIAIFASGSGSNAENITQYFSENSDVAIDLVLTNKPKAGVIERANRLNLELLVFNREEFYTQNSITQLLLDRKIDLIVLAGFLWLIPNSLIQAFPKRIVNVHPALLPAYGGKGMYGHHVHEAVIRNAEKKSGITIHLVNEKYDEGEILFQAEVDVLESDTSDTLASKIHQLEYSHFPKVIETYLNQLP
jgi:phosphoribosylglycinamide formyltransferase 1